jgi:hypothetical protein
VPSMLVVKFQAIILKDILLRNDISSVEIWWVMYNKCVNGTHKWLTLMNANDIQSFNEMKTGNINLRSDILTKWMESEINYSITDYIFIR